MINANGVYIFGCAVLLVGLLYVANGIYFRIKGKVIIGDHNPGKLMQKKYEKYFSASGLALEITITTLAAIIVAYSARSILRTQSIDSAVGMIIWGPLLLVIIASVTTYFVYRTFRNTK
jgi:hypothetical protein